MIYNKFSYYYDQIMDEIDYQSWTDLTLNYLNKGQSLLDLGCGTATFILNLKILGYDTYGIDNSSHILEVAREKAMINHANVSLDLMDISNFSIDKNFDVVTCFFDTINHLDSKEKVSSLLECVSNSLNPNGYFIFDVFSKFMMDEYGNEYKSDDFEDFSYTWKTTKTSDSLEHLISFTDFSGSYNETYYEYFYDYKDIINDNFKLVEVYGDFDKGLKPTSERIIVVLQKVK